MYAYLWCRCCSMIPFLTGPWTPWKLYICSRDQRMKLTWALLSVLIHKHVKGKPGARFTFVFHLPTALLLCFTVFYMSIAHSVQDLYLVLLFPFFLPAVMTRALTRWLSAFWWDFRRSWRVLRKERCSAWEGRWTCSYSRPWTLKTWAASFLAGNPGCDLEGSSVFFGRNYFSAANVVAFQICITILTIGSGQLYVFICISIRWMVWGDVFFINLLARKHYSLPPLMFAIQPKSK